MPQHRRLLILSAVSVPFILSSVFCLLSSAVLAADIYRSDFSRDLSGFSVQWTGSGKLDIALDPAVKGPSGAPALRTVVPEVSTGTVGVNIKVAGSRKWQIEVWGAARAEEGGVQLALQCWDANGHQVAWFGIGGLPAGEALKPVRSMVELPESVANLNLLVLHEKFRGTSWVADVSVKEFTLTPATERALAPKGPTRWATTSFLGPADPTMRDTLAKMLVAAGVTHTRSGIDWRSVEPVKGKYDFSGLDRELAELAHYGAKADVVFIHGTPEWASGKTWEKDLPPDRIAQPWLAKHAFFPPRDWGDWERFVTALATHFKGRVPAWEIMNEPDLWSEGFNGAHEDYKQYLQIAYRAAKKADPKCQVLLAAFVFGEWLPKLLSDGMAKWFDGVCVHPYSTEPAGCSAYARRAQITLALAGAPKPIYVTEVGYQSGGWKEGPAVKASEDEKARTGAQALQDLAKLSDFVCWYTASEKGNMYGLLRDEDDRLRPMPVYYDYGRLTGRLHIGDTSPTAVGSTANPISVARGQTAEVTLTARNTSTKPQRVRFWPVGFVTNLGFTLDKVRGLDWQGILKPGEAHRATVTVTPTAQAKGSYPVGVAVIGGNGNAVALGEVGVQE